MPQQEQTARTGTVTVTASGATGSPQNVTIVQAGQVNFSHLSNTQRCYFTFAGNSYYAFAYDYSAGLLESVTPGFISYDTYLSFNTQNPTSMTTHVTYIYNTDAGRYTQSKAYLDQGL